MPFKYFIHFNEIDNSFGPLFYSKVWPVYLLSRLLRIIINMNSNLFFLSKNLTENVVYNKKDRLSRAVTFLTANTKVVQYLCYTIFATSEISQSTIKRHFLMFQIVFQGQIWSVLYGIIACFSFGSGQEELSFYSECAFFATCKLVLGVLTHIKDSVIENHFIHKIKIQNTMFELELCNQKLRKKYFLWLPWQRIII